MSVCTREYAIRIFGCVCKIAYSLCMFGPIFIHLHMHTWQYVLIVLVSKHKVRSCVLPSSWGSCCNFLQGFGKWVNRSKVMRTDILFGVFCCSDGLKTEGQSQCDQLQVLGVDQWTVTSEPSNDCALTSKMLMSIFFFSPPITFEHRALSCNSQFTGWNKFPLTPIPQPLTLLIEVCRRWRHNQL